MPKYSYLEYARELRDEADEKDFILTPRLTRRLLDLVASLAAEVDALEAEQRQMAENQR